MNEYALGQDNVTLLAATTAGAVVGATGPSFRPKHAGFTRLSAVLSVTAAATEVNDTLDVFIDASIDEEATWINIVHFTQVLGNGGAKKFVAIAGPHNSDEFDVTADLAAGVVPRDLIGGVFRVRWTVVDPTGANASFTFNVKGAFKL